MNDAKAKSGPEHRQWHGTHHGWDYRPQAFRWIGEKIVGINFLPLATEMRAWLKQRGKLSIVTAANQKEGGYTNPYTFSGSSLALILARVVNAYFDYTTAQASGEEEVDAEVERFRLYNEVILYAARICEVSIKQLLFCTQIPESRFERMALGNLLESPCPYCKKANGKKPHLVSLVGTLAHPFHLCLEFEHCAMDHMDIVNKLRNSQAAHSEIQSFVVRPLEASKAKLRADCDAVMNGFLHMLSHLEQLEEKMLDDLAKKGEIIELLRLNGLPAEECNFKLTPGRPFVVN